MYKIINWRTVLFILAMIIVGFVLIYVKNMAKEMEKEEYAKVNLTIEGIKYLSDINNKGDNTFATYIISQNTTIPMIMTDEDGLIVSSNNFDEIKIKKDPKYVERKLKEFKTQRKPIIVDFVYSKNYIYYGDSDLLQKLKYYPILLLFLTLSFLFIVFIAIYNVQKSIQNQVWVGMSKETAHQMGTPLSSIEGWMEVLKDNEGNEEWIEEMSKDVNRLKLVADRFSKIGSIPQLKEENIITHLSEMVDYMQKRAPKKVKIYLDYGGEEEVSILLSGPLFDWVIENLIRNALDAMEGQGEIHITVKNELRQVTIDVCDTGKGIPKNKFKTVFNPGYSTKQRGWGLGLSLAKRIINNYHHGSIIVKNSELGKGTTFRILLIR